MAQAVYWIGQNGNIYYGSGLHGAPVQNLGKQAGNGGGQFKVGANGLYDVFTDSGKPQLTFAAKQITDPALGDTSPAPDGGAGGAAGPVLNSAGVSNTQKTIDQIPALLHAALSAEDTSFGNTTGGFDAAEGTQRKTYDDSTVTNQQNYDSTFMDSIRAGIKGLGGVLNILRGTGAGGGTAEDLARDTVGGVTANDIRSGADTQKGNQGELDSSLSSFLTDLGIKRKTAEDTHVNNTRAINRDSNSQLQDLYAKMAGFYGDAGDTTAANEWTNRAGNLTPDIAANSRTQVSKYDQTPVVIHAPNLTAFAPPTQPSTIAPPSDGQVGSGIFTMSDPRRRRDTAPTTAPVAAPVGV